jgi:hypothetical protein
MSARPEAARVPRRFRERVLADFRSPTNVAYLRAALACLLLPGPARDYAVASVGRRVQEYGRGEGAGYDVVGDDPTALRGVNARSTRPDAELQRLNWTFLRQTLALVQDLAGLYFGAPPQGFDTLAQDDEPEHMRMFIADSLRPAGLAHLNTPGPAYAILEDQAAWAGPGGAGPDGGRRPRAACAPGGGCARARAQREGFASSYDPSWAGGTEPGPQPPPAPLPGGPPGGYEYGTLPRGRAVAGAAARLAGVPDGAAPDPADPDDAWDAGNPDRDPEIAVAQYWGEGAAATDLRTAEAPTGHAYGDKYAWGDAWLENGGSRFMRWENIPFWQKSRRIGYDEDIEENLGQGYREAPSHVRRWDMDRLREPDGMTFRRLGPRGNGMN